MLPEEDLAKWRKIRDYMISNSSTDNWYYKRAVAICDGQPDPFDKFHKMTPHLALVDTPEPPDAA
jgi:hypothetical protein